MSRGTTRSGIVVAALALAGAGLTASPVIAATPTAPGVDATVSVLHAIPAGLGADVVDVYAGRLLLVDDLTPGRLATVKVPPGAYTLTVMPDGRTPGSSAALLTAPRSRVPAGANLTVTANLSRTGKPTLTVFANDTTTVGDGKGRLTVRHIAAAPALDVRIGGSALLTGLRNPQQGDVGLNAGAYRMQVVLAGTRKALVGPETVTIRNKPGRDDMGTNTIVYVWGSGTDGPLQQSIQNVRIDLQ